MFKHILIATDGSELARMAETTGLSLAKELEAQATVVTVTEPWDALSMAALADRGVRNPVADYDEAVAASANRILWGVTETAKKIGVACTTAHAKDKYQIPGRGYSRHGQGKRLRSDRHGLAWPAGPFQGSARQPDDQGCHLEHHPCARVPLDRSSPSADDDFAFASIG